MTYLKLFALMLVLGLAVAPAMSWAAEDAAAEDEHADDEHADGEHEEEEKGE